MSRRLQALRVGNFKAFADTQRIPLKPITLVFGPNSAGKSSFIHSLALAHEAQFGREKRGRSRLDVHHTDIGGNAIDLGGFRQYVFRGQLNRRVELGAELKVSELDPKKHQRLIGLLGDANQISVSITIGIELDDKDQPVRGAEPEVVAVEFLCDGEDFIRMSRRRAETLGKSGGSSMRVDRINTDHIIFQTIVRAVVEAETTTELKQEDLTAAQEAIANLLPDLLVRVERLYPSAVELSPRNTALKNVGKAVGAGLLAGAAFGPLGLAAGLAAGALLPVSKGNRAEQLAQTVRLFIPSTLSDLILGVCDAIASELGQFNYLGPLRSFPPRHLAFAEHEDANWYAGGGYAWDVVRRDDDVRRAVNDWLGAEKLKTRYRLVVRSFKDIDDLQEPISAALEDYESWKETRETDTAELEAEVDGLTFNLQELDEKLSSARDLQANMEAVLSTNLELEEKNELASAYARVCTLVEELEAEEESLNKELSDKQSDLHGRLGEDINDSRAEELLSSLASSESETVRELALIDQRTGATVSHRDVGIGISQVLPVLVMAYGSQGKILAMEQPEIHLHPALQAELGDVFIESALGARKNTFILETHSEHLILRLLRRIRETSEGQLPTGMTPVRPQDVGVLYVLPGKDGSVISEIPVRTDGEFITDWPDGFFPERGEEIF